MYNYFNFKKLNDEFLLTNDFGKYVFLKPAEFKELLSTKSIKQNQLNMQMQKDVFLYNSSEKAFIDENAYKMCDAKQYLFHSTQLHIFVVTSSCNMQCIYCQAQNGEKQNYGFMTEDLAKRAVDIALQSPAEHLQFEFQGGEPLLNFEIIKFIVEYSKQVCKDKTINYTIVSNLTVIDDDMIDFIIENRVTISTSLDGNENIHNNNRSYKNGTGTYEDVIIAIKKLKSKGIHIGALLTTTRECFGKEKEIIDTYVALGFDSISLRPLTPLGCANKSWEKIGYTAEEFVVFYQDALDYIIEISNDTRITEGIASVFLTKILDGWGSNYMELRSPCGASLGQIAYYFDGNIYTCDEGRMAAEMGDSSFSLGNVYDDNYDTLIENDVCKGICSASILESLPSCMDCVYQPYCGVCPIINYVLDGDVYEKTPNNYKCQINKGILDTIFSKLQKRESELVNMFWRWIR